MRFGILHIPKLLIDQYALDLSSFYFPIAEPDPALALLCC